VARDPSRSPRTDVANTPPEPGTHGRVRPKLADVAARAGVSINTVSRSLRAPQTVRPELRQRIRVVMDELDYVPNRLAGGLAGGHTGVVGVVITTLFYSEFAALIDTLQQELAAAGLQVMLGNSAYDPEEELRLVRAMLSWRPAALAVVGVDHHPKADALLRSSGVPVIELWDSRADGIDSGVGMDHRAIGRLQTGHVYAMGYRRPAFVGSMRANDFRAWKRFEGHAEVVASAAGRPLRFTSPEGGAPGLGERLLHDALARDPMLDGIVCNSDVIAMGVLRGLRGLGRRVPEEIGVIGFGDNEAGSCLEPTLTTIRPPRVEIGKAAARLILARIDGAPPAHLVFEGALVPRDSTARDRGGSR
jgi:LacI family gluconate utilization system Gnt-I transcriptional repressor